jgi:Tfp pilus assembly protein PilP
LAVSGPEVAGGVPDTVAHDWQGDVEAVAARALFHPARLAKAEVAEVGASPAPTRPDPAAPAFTATLQMVGYFDQGGQRSAILKTVEDGHSHMVREGDEIAGARVQQINPDAVVIEAAGRETTLKLYPD